MLIYKKAQRLLWLTFITGIFWLTSLRAAVLTGIDPTIISVGSGVDISYLVIDESTLYSTPLEFVYHYTYDSNHPLTGFQLLTNVVSDSSLANSTTFYGGGLGNALTSLTYQGGATVIGTNAPDYSTGTYWSYYLSGGLDGGVVPLTFNQWNYANNGMDFRTVTPGSWDGWTFASYSDYGNTTIDVPPSVALAAVPEPRAFVLAIIYLVSLLLISRWKYSTRKFKN